MSEYTIKYVFDLVLRPFNGRLIAFVASAVYLVKQGTCATTPVTFALDVGAHRGALHFN
jgi:hypothetical protein